MSERILRQKDYCAQEEEAVKELSSLATAVQASTTLAIDALAKQMRADGIDVIGFGAGEPDFNTPEHIKEAAIEAIRENFTKYTPSAGIMPLREAVCLRMREDCGLDYRPSQVVIASGAKHNVYIALRALVNPGDEVILPAPYWVSYYEMIKMVGGVPVVVNGLEENQFKITAQQLAQAITPRTKCLIFNNPSNPTGMVYSREELAGIARVCVEHELYVIAVEIYYGLLSDGLTFTSFASLGEDIRELTILINGVSKSYAMTGWRVGYAIANETIAKVMGNYLSHSTGAPSSVSQRAAVAALTGPQGETEVMRRAFEQRRDYIVKRIAAIPEVSCIKPEGAFYLMMNISRLVGRSFFGEKIANADDFCSALLKHGLVATVPGTGFGAPEYVRWSYATSLENIEKGMDRLEKFLKG